MTRRTAMYRAPAATAIVALALLAPSTGAEAAPRRSSVASCVATLTVAETGIEPGFVANEVARIHEHGPGALAALVRSLAGEHLGAPDACAALAGE